MAIRSNSRKSASFDRFRNAGTNSGARIAAIQRNKQFEAEYKHARIQWAAGLPAVFPHGTFWLSRHANITVRGESSTTRPTATAPPMTIT